MDAITLELAAFALVLPVIGFLGGWFLKPHPLKNKLIMVARRPSSDTGRILAIRPQGGRYTYEEKKRQPMDIYTDGVFLWRDPFLDCKFIDVDLDAGHPIRYNGICQNDDDAVEVTRRDGTTVKLTEVWRRLSGQRLYQIRKDTRLNQLAAIGTGLWDFLVRIAPICLILIFILLVVLVVMVGIGFIHH